jgi:para-nitrobenzyl esterase
MALRWLQSHIAAFGGDPGAVTLFGQSMGGVSGLCHLTQPESFQGVDLYHRVIIQSSSSLSFVPMGAAERLYSMVLNSTGCSHVQCLVDLDAFSVYSAMPMVLDLEYQTNVVIDGVTQPADAYAMLMAGLFNKAVPVIIGHNRDEFETAMHTVSTVSAAAFAEENFDSLLLRSGFSTQPASSFNASSLALVKELYSRTTLFYPANSTKSYWWWAAVAVGSDMSDGQCFVRRVARMISAGGAAVYGYVFEHAPQQSFLHYGIVGWNYSRGVHPGNDASAHMMELDYAFGDTRGVAPGEAELAAKIGAAWASFAVFGTPGIGWPRFQTDDDVMLHLDTEAALGIRPARGYRRQQCSFWDAMHVQGGLVQDQAFTDVLSDPQVHTADQRALSRGTVGLTKLSRRVGWTV